MKTMLQVTEVKLGYIQPCERGEERGARPAPAQAPKLSVPLRAGRGLEANRNGSYLPLQRLRGLDGFAHDLKD